MDSKIGVGIIGCGAIAKFRHAPEYAANENCEIIAFSDALVSRADALSRIYGGRVYNDYREMLKNPEIKAVSVCTANDTHAAIAIEALNAGKHVLCEKPMATNLDDARKMIEASHDNNKILMIDYNQRFVPAHKKAKEIIRRGDMGRVISFRSSFKHKGPETWSIENKNTWFFNANKAGFGALGDLGTHKLDLIGWLLDDDINKVYASMVTLDKKDNYGKPITVEDNAFCMVCTENGVMGSIEASWTNYGQEDNSTVLYCENGVMKIFTSTEADIVCEMKDSSTALYNLGGISTNEHQQKSGVIDEFISCIINNMPSPISGEEGYKSLALLDACFKSAKINKWIEI